MCKPTWRMQMLSWRRFDVEHQFRRCMQVTRRFPRPVNADFSGIQAIYGLLLKYPAILLSPLHLSNLWRYSYSAYICKIAIITTPSTISPTRAIIDYKLSEQWQTWKAIRDRFDANFAEYFDPRYFCFKRLGYRHNLKFKRCKQRKISIVRSRHVRIDSARSILEPTKTHRFG